MPNPNDDYEDPVNEYLAYLCGDDLIAWARLVQIIMPLAPQPNA